MQITLAKALNLKNKFAGELKHDYELLRKYSSVKVGETIPFDQKELYAKWKLTLARLIEIKTKLAVANTGIYGLIYSIAELKGQIVSLRELNTKSGKFKAAEYVDGKPAQVEHEYNAILDEKQVEEEVKEIENLISEYQDKISAFNHTTQIEISD